MITKYTFYIKVFKFYVEGVVLPIGTAKNAGQCKSCRNSAKVVETVQKLSKDPTMTCRS